MRTEICPDTATSTPLHNVLHLGEQASVIFAQNGAETEVILRGLAAKAAPLIAAIFNAAHRKSNLFDVIERAVIADDDPNRDTIGDLARALQIHADACCPVCGQYRPDEDEWHEIDGRLMCASCCDDEAAKYAEMHAHAPSAADLRRPGVAVYAMTEGL